MLAAVEDGEVDTVKELLKELGPHSVDTIGPEGDSLLHIACLYDHEACVKLLLQHGASALTKDEDNGTCLHDASASGCDTVHKRMFVCFTSSPHFDTNFFLI